MLQFLSISDFNTKNFDGYIQNNNFISHVNIIDKPYGQVHQLLVDDNADCWTNQVDVVVVWTQPQGVIPSIQKLINHENIEINDILNEVDIYANLLLKINNRSKIVIVPTWALPTYERGMGILDYKNKIGFRHIISKINLRISEILSEDSNYFVLDTQKWIEYAGKDAFSPKLWYMAKIPFSNSIFKSAAEEVVTIIKACSGISKKLIILDLDDTIWGGIVGDAGKENLILGGHDAEGEALVDFQKSLKALTNRGIILGIVSKNQEDIALDAIQNHPEMILRLNDFAGWRINWEDKAKNIYELVNELNLGLNSVVFIDDNPVERARVQEALPDVYVPEWPKDKTLYRKALVELSCFDVSHFTQEDRERSKMYTSDRERKAMIKNLSSLEDWLHTLNITVEIEKLNHDNLVRTTQLLNKTNQMNLSTRRLTEAELLDWSQNVNHQIYVFRVSDKFGSLGLTGILGMENRGQNLKIIDFILSCRVMGRKVEETMLATAVRFARNIRALNVNAKYIATQKNKPCLDFFMRSGFNYEPDNFTFNWKSDRDYPYPDQITIRGEIS